MFSVNTSQGEHPFEDSFTLDHYIHVTKRDTLALKKVRKEQQQPPERPIRKGSTQMSIFSWLNKGPAQQCKMVQVDKSLILKIFGYLRLSELVAASRVCSYFMSCYRSLWTDKEFFGQLETDKFTSEELGKVIKSSRLDHIKQLKQIYLGKNIRFCRQKIKIKAGNGGANSGGMLQIFSVIPKNPHAGSTFIMDSHLAQVINSSFKSLKVIELVKCSFLKDFVCLSRCIELTKLVVTFNDNFKNQDLGVICKRCVNLEYLHFEGCRRLDQNIFEHLQYVELLQTLKLRSFRQSFLKLKKLANNPLLKTLDLEGSMINDLEAYQVIELKQLTFLSVKHCELLTDRFVEFLVRQLPKTKLTQVDTSDCEFQQQKIKMIESQLQQRHL